MASFCFPIPTKAVAKSIEGDTGLLACNAPFPVSVEGPRTEKTRSGGFTALDGFGEFRLAQRGQQKYGFGPNQVGGDG